MSNRSQIILFGDLTCDAITGLQTLVTIKDNPLLTSFFERVVFSLRAEIGSLPYAQRGDFVQFINFPELLARVQRLPCLHPALEKTLVCVYQFGCFIKSVALTYIMSGLRANGSLAITLRAAIDIRHRRERG